MHIVLYLSVKCAFFCFVDICSFSRFVLIQVRWSCIKFKFSLAAKNLITHVLTYIVFAICSFFVRCLILVFYFADLNEIKINDNNRAQKLKI